MSTPTINPNASMHQMMFAPGMSALTSAALLQWMEDMTQIANLYGEQFVKQIQAQNNSATALGEAMVNLGQMEMKDYMVQGGMTMLSGAVSGVAGIKNYTESSSLSSGLENEQTGIKNAQTALDSRQEEISLTDKSSVQPTTQELPKEEFEELISRKTYVDENGKPVDLSEKISKLSPEQAQQYQIALQGQGNQIANDYQTKQQNQSEKFNKLKLAVEGLQGITSSASSFNTAVQKENEGEENKDQAILNAVLQGLQQTSSRSVQQSDQMMGQASQVTQELVAISNANRGAN